MPNHTANILEVSGPNPTAPIEFMSSEVSDFDFENIIPMPECLQIGGVPGETDEPLWSLVAKLNNEGDSLEDYERESLETQIKMKKNRLDTGYASWYDWSCAHWGTKWNAYDVAYTPGESYIYFETAWSPPEPVIIALSAKFPEYEFALKYADEGGGFLGISYYKNGTRHKIEEYDWYSEEGIELRQYLGYYYEEDEEEYA